MLLLVSTLVWASGGEAPVHGDAAGGAEHAAAGAEHATHGVPWDMVGLQAVNLLFFIVILVWVARKPLGDALKNRALGVSQALDEASRLRADASARAAEIDAKLATLGQKVEEMKAAGAIEADIEAKRMNERAHADAERIRDTAERTLREESGRARNALRGEAARLAVQLARETLKRSVTADDQERLAREFLAAVDKETPNG
jgi:F-type H+-transporting ATPase subunit b